MQYDLIPEANWYRVLRKIDKDGYVGLKFSGSQLEITFRKHIIGELHKIIELLFCFMFVNSTIQKPIAGFELLWNILVT